MKKKRIHRNRIIVLFLVLFFIGSLTFIQVKLNNASFSDSQKVLHEKNEKLKKVKSNNKRLKISVKELKDKDYIQKWIRSKYFYSKNGDTIYNFGSN